MKVGVVAVRPIPEASDDCSSVISGRTELARGLWTRSILEGVDHLMDIKWMAFSVEYQVLSSPVPFDRQAPLHRRRLISNRDHISAVSTASAPLSSSTKVGIRSRPRPIAPPVVSKVKLSTDHQGSSAEGTDLSRSTSLRRRGLMATTLQSRVPTYRMPSPRMEAQNSRASQVIEVDIDAPEGASGLGANTICGGATCDFSDSKTSSKDAKERSASMRKLLMAVVLCIIFMAVEVIGGIKANSLSILTDAAHLLSDVAAFAISLFSLWASGWEATPHQSYGFFRIEILGALVSIQLIWLLAGILVYEAIVRIIHGSGGVQGFLMFAVSAFGLVVNIIMAVLLGHDHGHGGHNHDHGGHSHSHGKSDHDHSLHQDDHSHGHAHGVEHGHSHSISITAHHHHLGEDKHKDEHEPLLKHLEEAHGVDAGSKGTKKQQRNINVHSAYLHVLGDSIQSIGVMIGGALIWYKPEWKIIDLVCTLIFSVIVLLTTIKMLRNILEVLMESTPREIDATRLEKGLCEMEGVVAVHELHIWAITVGKVLLACHVTITPEANADYVLDKVIGYIRREYNISHVTIQIERQ